MSNYVRLTALLAASLAVTAATTPPQVYNNYSFIPPGAPNHVVAQGSIIAIKNSIGPADFSPIQATPTAGYGGVTINVTVNGTTTQVLNYYVGPQLAGVLPSNTPVGTGTYTVTYNGTTTDPAPITVVQNSFGVLTMNSSGQGTAKVCDYNFDKNCLTFASYAQSAKPGDVITIWGSGLGPTTNDAISVDMTQTVPVEVWIGGKQATVTYAARSQFVGLDLINTSIPADVSVGCYVSVVVKIGNNVSNQTSLPVDPNGAACSDPVNGISGTDLANLLTKDSFKTGAVSFSHTTTSAGTKETADASFFLVKTADVANYQQAFPFASPGSCTVWTINVDISNPNIPLPTPLDAGTITIAANGSSKTLTKNATSGTYSLDLGTGGFLTGTISASGSGGTDVGAFTGSIAANSGFTWTNAASVTTINRSAGQQITWSNPAANSFVTMSGESITVDLTTQIGAAAFFTCIANGSDLQFTIPPSVLLGIPASSTQIPIPGSLTVSNSTTPVPFTATGLDYGFLEFATSTSQSVTYQ
jgi:uncharacterized protein (TIGR03437 family)